MSNQSRPRARALTLPAARSEALMIEAASLKPSSFITPSAAKQLSLRCCSVSHVLCTPDHATTPGFSQSATAKKGSPVASSSLSPVSSMEGVSSHPTGASALHGCERSHESIAWSSRSAAAASAGLIVVAVAANARDRLMRRPCPLTVVALRVLVAAAAFTSNALASAAASAASRSCSEASFASRTRSSSVGAVMEARRLLTAVTDSRRAWLVAADARRIERRRSVLVLMPASMSDMKPARSSPWEIRSCCGS
mmetsp:Transcript_21648/g.51671  ORF Transcript_21648/g.51671 Transcript_21648/m.51671 type:complete len:253 (+) Transcript_21648:1212-1970(+)